MKQLKNMKTSPEDPMIENRRVQLRKWIAARFAGSQAAFIASTNDGKSQLNQGELSALLSKKTFGEKRARSMERQGQMPIRYLDSVDEVVCEVRAAEPPPPNIVFRAKAELSSSNSGDIGVFDLVMQLRLRLAPVPPGVRSAVISMLKDIADQPEDLVLGETTARRIAAILSHQGNDLQQKSTVSLPANKAHN